MYEELPFTGEGVEGKRVLYAYMLMNLETTSEKIRKKQLPEAPLGESKEIGAFIEEDVLFSLHPWIEFELPIVKTNLHEHNKQNCFFSW